MDIQCNNCKSYLNIREVVTRCTECKELIFKPKTKNMKNNFKEGDKVFVAPYGWCEYCHESVNVGKVVVKYKFIYHEVDIFHVSFTEYKLEGFTQERPFTPEVGKFYFFYDEYMLRDETLIYAKLSQIIDNTTYVTTAGGYFEKISETNPLL